MLDQDLAGFPHDTGLRQRRTGALRPCARYAGAVRTLPVRALNRICPSRHAPPGPTSTSCSSIRFRMATPARPCRRWPSSWHGKASSSTRFTHFRPLAGPTTPKVRPIWRCCSSVLITAAEQRLTHGRQLNELAQGPRPMSQGIEWFDSLGQEEQSEVLLFLRHHCARASCPFHSQLAQRGQLFLGEFVASGFGVGDPTPSFTVTGSSSPSTVICSVCPRGTGRWAPSRSTHCVRAASPRWKACCALPLPFTAVPPARAGAAPAGAGTAPRAV